MGVLRDANLVAMIFKLMDRGLTGEQIERAMKQMIGPDWKELKVSIWLQRLKSQGFILQDERELSVNDLEALVKGRLKLDDIGRSKRF
jgi:hypothetical protein